MARLGNFERTQQLIAALIGLLWTVTAKDPVITPDPVDPVIGIGDETDRAPIDPAPDQVGTEPDPNENELIDYDLYICWPDRPGDNCVLVEEPTTEEITPTLVLAETRRVGLPRLHVAVQPAGSTLVNLETIFHTTAAPFERSVDILDSTVALRATPASYTWHHGDGTTQTTTSPGRPYPALDIVHRYREPGRASARVDVTYRVAYRIDDGAWQQLDTTITATGPATTLRIREARPVLTR
ncbi:MULTISPECIES: hypothetical protein [unclassified Aeromicrobium]|uniref:hypothetical protein n=1 Tax=unclassified Aeromicrobium TaxID=2633570 RepID=UPI00396B42C1